MSCGLGRVQRGFEVSAGRWAAALGGQPGLDVRLFCGGPHDGATVVSNLPRNGMAAGLLRRVGLIHDGCRLEQLSFGLGVLKELVAWKPDVVWLQEYTLALSLRRWRQRFGLKFRLLFCNGAPLGPEECQHFDYIQHLAPDSLENARRFGLPEDRMELLPHCTPEFGDPPDRAGLRREFGFSDDDWVILSLAAWNRHHKRIDYLIEEVAALDDPKVQLFLCGQEEEETAGLRELAARRLPGRARWMTLPQDEVVNALAVADVFVLASTREALGAVLVEAAMSGCPVLTHRHPASEYILEEDTWLGDFSKPGALKQRLQQWRHRMPSPDEIARLRASVTARFSDRSLAPRFAAMAGRATRNPTIP